MKGIALALIGGIALTGLFLETASASSRDHYRHHERYEYSRPHRTIITYNPYASRHAYPDHKSKERYSRHDRHEDNHDRYERHSGKSHFRSPHHERHEYRR
jgi:hypothetical protein